MALLAAVPLVQAAEPRETPGDYPAHADTAAGVIAAEYLVHSIPTDEGMFPAGKYLVIEVGIFPKRGSEMVLSNGQFQLEVNGKPVRDPQSAGMIAASLKYPDWEPSRNISGGMGPVIVGGPAQTSRFPGDPTSRPAPQPVPQDDPTGMPKQRLSVDELIARAALPEGTLSKPAGGCLFFRYDGKTKKIRTLELVWEPPSSAPVKLPLKSVQ